ncbi:MAG TPA: 50S ribosomal protein L25 [Candidatus Sulfotelmatobacter sp.]|nr:50S ribosomal protein L25 [Candidatus Sulfotelmatobacter sp.]
MSKQHTLNTLTLEPRSEAGTTTAHALRRAGKVPGVVYGHGQATPITITAKDLSELLLSGNRAHVVTAKIGKTTESVLLRRIETDPITRKALSVDFQRVTKDEAIYATVPIVTVGTSTGVKDHGGVLDVSLRALEVKGPASSIPDKLEIDVTELDVHQHLTAGQIALPKGFTLVTPADTLVVGVEITRAEAAEAPEAPAAAAAPGAEAPAAPAQG